MARQEEARDGLFNNLIWFDSSSRSIDKRKNFWFDNISLGVEPGTNFATAGMYICLNLPLL